MISYTSVCFTSVFDLRKQETPKNVKQDFHSYPLFTINFSYYVLGEERGYCKCGKCTCKDGYHGENCGKVNCTIGERKCYNSKGVSCVWFIGCCRLHLMILTIARRALSFGTTYRSKLTNCNELNST